MIDKQVNFVAGPDQDDGRPPFWKLLHCSISSAVQPMFDYYKLNRQLKFHFFKFKMADSGNFENKNLTYLRVSLGYFDKISRADTACYSENYNDGKQY